MCCMLLSIFFFNRGLVVIYNLVVIVTTLLFTNVFSFHFSILQLKLALFAKAAFQFVSPSNLHLFLFII